MIVKNLKFGEEAKDQVFKGIKKLTNAVSSTLGASGKCVILEDANGNPIITKDGVTVANSILLNDPVENLGVSMMKQAAQKTASMAGDGTPTSIVLTQAIIDCYYNKEGNKRSFRDIKSGINKFKDHVINFLANKAVKVDNEELYNVSTISANNDAGLGGIIAKAL